MIDAPARLKPPPERTIVTQTPRLIVKFFLKHGTVIDWPIPAGQPFNFGGLITGIRANAGFLSDDLYIPADEIACIGFGGAARVQHPMHITRQ